jgi:RNA polymerase sigma factor (sigma-70 family)
MTHYIQQVHVLRDPGATTIERQAAFTRLMAQFGGMVRSVAIGFLGDDMQADDAVQETFLAAWQNIASLREPARFPGWLRRVALWECHYFKRVARPTVDIDTLIDHLDDDTDIAADSERAELSAQVREVLWALPRPHREILILHYLEHFGQTELAELLELSEGAVRKRLHDARQRTRGLFERWLRQGHSVRRQANTPSLWSTMMTRITPDADGRSPQEKIDALHRPKWCVASDDGRLYWDLICAAIRNDAETLRQHLQQNPDCARLEFWYTPPVNFAVREGCLEATEVLWEAYACEDVTGLIHLAEDRGHAAIATYLRTSTGSAAAESDLRLHEAVEAADVAEMARLLSAVPDIGGRRDPQGRTALHVAAATGNADLLRCLLAGDIDVDATDHMGFRAVHCTLWRDGYWHAAAGGGELLQILLANGAADSPTLAAARGDLAAVQGFVAADSEAANSGEALQKRPLSAAVEGGHREIVRYLLDEGAKPNLSEGRRCPNGSALMTATVNDDLQIAGWLLAAGADPNGYTDSSGTPATRATSDPMRGLLYGYGGHAAATWGFLHRGDFETVAATLRHCADPFSHEDSEYLTTPYTAVISGCMLKARNGESTAAHEAMLQMFLQRQFPMPKVLSECKNYLYRVPEMTRQLLEHSLDANLPDWQNRTPLHDICAGEKDTQKAIELIQMFLEHGADIEAVDEADRSTPLGLAAREGHLELVELLLATGARPDGAGASWATPLAWAQRRRHGAVAELLRSRGA